MVSSVAEFATKLRAEKAHPIVQTEGALREIHDAVTEMIKQLANEPSVGLYFVQQHVHKAVPVLVSLKAQMVDNTREVEYATQDVKDALNSVKSMTEVGPVVLERMIQILDASVPHLASLRPLKSLHPDHSEHQNNSRRSPNFSSVEQSSAYLTVSSSSSVATQGRNNSGDPYRMSPTEVLIGKEVPGNPTPDGPYSSYMKTMFGSAFQRASSVTVANLAKWNSFSVSGRPESTTTIFKENSCPDVRSEVDARESARVPSSSVAASDVSARLGETASEEYHVTGAPKENVASELEKSEVQKLSFPSGSTSLPALRQVSDFGNPAQYVRTLLGSARLSLEHRSREGANAASAEASTTLPTAEKPQDTWSWFQIPSKAVRSLNRQPHSEGNLSLEEVVGDMAMKNQNTSSSGSKEDIQRLLDMESASCAAFAEEKAAKLEEWLQDTEDAVQKETE